MDKKTFKRIMEESYKKNKNILDALKEYDERKEV